MDGTSRVLSNLVSIVVHLRNPAKKERFASTSLCRRISFIFDKVNIKNKLKTRNNIKMLKKNTKPFTKINITKYREL